MNQREIKYPNKPGDGHSPVKTIGNYGMYEAHSCVEGCELTIYVCELCGGDFHEKHPDKGKCPLDK